MSREIYLSKIEERIKKSVPGSVFTTADFSDMTTSDTANRALLRMVDAGLLRRIMRGIYEYPEYSDFLKESVSPSAGNVANAIARNFGWTIVPSGDLALNMLGLSTQVPATWLFVSDGPTKEYSFDNTTLKYKHTSNKEISKISYKTSLIIQALKSLGKNRITDNVVISIANTLNDEEKRIMLTESKYVTSWIYEIIKRICK